MNHCVHVVCVFIRAGWLMRRHSCNIPSIYCNLMSFKVLPSSYKACAHKLNNDSRTECRHGHMVHGEQNCTPPSHPLKLHALTGTRPQCLYNGNPTDGQMHMMPCVPECSTRVRLMSLACHVRRTLTRPTGVLATVVAWLLMRRGPRRVRQEIVLERWMDPVSRRAGSSAQQVPVEPYMRVGRLLTRALLCGDRDL